MIKKSLVFLGLLLVGGIVLFVSCTMQRSKSIDGRVLEVRYSQKIVKLVPKGSGPTDAEKSVDIKVVHLSEEEVALNHDMKLEKTQYLKNDIIQIEARIERVVPAVIDSPSIADEKSYVVFRVLNPNIKENHPGRIKLYFDQYGLFGERFEKDALWMIQLNKSDELVDLIPLD